MDTEDKERKRYALVLAGGDPVDPAMATTLPPGPWVIAADSGLAQAGALGMEVDVVIGDMDSVDVDDLRTAEAGGAEIDLHPTDKDATDLELALDRVVMEGYGRVVLVGGVGGRLDHLLGNALLLASERFAAISTEWWIGPNRVYVVRPGMPTAVAGDLGDTVSLFAIGGPCSGVRTQGLRWHLDDETLPSGSTRGVSNEIEHSPASVSTARGTLLVIHERTPM